MSNIYMLETGVTDALVTGAFHGWFSHEQLVEIANFYGITWNDLIEYAVDELDYDIDTEEMHNVFGGRNDYMYGKLEV